MTRIILLGEYSPSLESHQVTDAALAHSSAAMGIVIETQWISTAAISDAQISSADAVWVAPGSPYKSLDATLRAIRLVRVQRIPCLGTCGGFQHIILEYARNQLGFEDAQHAEYDPYASRIFLSRLACSLVGRELPLTFTPESQVATAYGATSAVERYYCNFGVNPECVAQLKQGPLRIVGHDVEGEIRVVELPGHPFFVGTLFLPQARSSPGNPHPLVTAFVRAAADYSRARA